MEYKLTSHIQCNKRGKDGKCRSYILFFINDIQILKQKYPYDDTYEDGFNHKTDIYDVYVLNGKMHQTRSFYGGCGSKVTSKKRKVSYPLSKKKLNELDILPEDKIIM